MKELVIKKDSDRVEFENLQDMIKFIQGYKGFILFYSISGGRNSIDFFHGGGIDEVSFGDNSIVTAFIGEEKKDNKIKYIIYDHYKLFTCSSFDEAYLKMKEMEGER